MSTPLRLIQTERVVVISPSDVKDERMALFQVIEELNRTVAKAYDVHLELWTWETDSFPGFHRMGPQGLIDDLLAENDPDIVIGIFWHRIGTPLPGESAETKTTTGTEHEFQGFYSKWQQTGRPKIFFYFKNAPYSPRDRQDLIQWQGVFAFKETFPDSGFFWGFSDTREFETLVRNHLAMALVQKYSKSFAKGVAIVDTKQALTKALMEIIAGAERYLLTTGSRSHDSDYFKAIETRMKNVPALRYYRILFGPPHHRELKDHLAALVDLRGGPESCKTVFVTMFDRTARQAEVSLCANESRGLLVLPSFNQYATFDSGIIFTEPTKVEALYKFVTQLRDDGTPVKSPRELRTLDEDDRVAHEDGPTPRASPRRSTH
jgi:hypothetical protein